MEELRTLLSETPILALKDQQDEVLSLEHNNTVGDALKVSPETSSAADAAAISETQHPLDFLERPECIQNSCNLQL